MLQILVELILYLVWDLGPDPATDPDRDFNFGLLVVTLFVLAAGAGVTCAIMAA